MNGHRCWPVVAVMVSFGILACGGNAKHALAPATQVKEPVATNASSAHAAKQAPVQGVDGDYEDTSAVKTLADGRYDQDDVSLLHFGRLADTKELRAVTSVVDRYHAAMAANNGAKGCALLYSLVLEGMIEDFHHPLGKIRKTCANVLTWLFRDTHRRHEFDADKLHVIQVQVRGNEALALMGSHGRIEHSVAARRERELWKVAEINGGRMP